VWHLLFGTGFRVDFSALKEESGRDISIYIYIFEKYEDDRMV